MTVPDGKVDGHACAHGRRVGDGDESLDPVVGGDEHDRKRLDDLELACRGEREIGVERLDVERRRRGAPDEKDDDRRESQRSHQNLTFGASRCASSSSAKNSRGLKPNMPAMRFPGKTSIAVLKSLTTAL